MKNHKFIQISFLFILNFLLTSVARAEGDIDIFTGASGGAAAAPTVMFMLDNTPNWSRQSEGWLIGSTKVTQGQAELNAIKNVLPTLNSSVKIGLAMMNVDSKPASVTIPAGGYIRYGARDMADAANGYENKNKLSALIDLIYNDVDGTNEKINQANKDESSAFSELYRYFKGMTPRSGVQSISGPKQNNVDVMSNSGPNNRTPFALGLRGGFAIDTALNKYSSPVTGATCGGSYVIYIANNANQTGVGGASYYDGIGGGDRISAGTSISTTTASYWIDEWARTLYQSGTTVYVLDAWNDTGAKNSDKHNVEYSTVLMSAAKVGGGRYFQVGSKAAIDLALAEIFTEIQAVNSAFASASLPVNATNRSQNKNQVFIGSFRPDPDAKARWPGNLKQYQIANTGSSLDLVDQLGRQAIVGGTGFIGDCAVSFWTTDTSSVGPATPFSPYWGDVPGNPAPRSACTTAPVPTVAPLLPAGTTVPSVYSDWPDGGAVEKGGVAEVLRKGNNPPTTQTSPTWLANSSTRNIYTFSAGALTAFNAASTGLTAGVVNWVYGADNNASTSSPGPEKVTNGTTNSRPFLHGDVIHSRPLPIVSGTDGSEVSVYYGSNDGTLRSVDGNTGRERWAFIAPEFNSKIQRLYDNSPLVNYPGLPSGLTPTPVAKDYFFDGEIGVYQNAESAATKKVWIYPSMRRGGRMIYALDVSTATAAPTYMWRFGCSNISVADTASCTTGATQIGQTWSAPVVARIKGYPGGTDPDAPVVIVGGGYDPCEDANLVSPSCSSTKGNIVYVLDARTGGVIRSFPTTRSVVANASLISASADGLATHAFIADTGGNVYRIDFVNSAGVAQASTNWTIHRVAYTSGGGRKFLFQPSLLLVNNGRSVYVGIGSGDREHPLASQYPYSSVSNRFYVFIDDLALTNREVNLDETRTSENYYLADYTSLNCTTATTCASQSVVPTPASTSPTKVGWFIQLNSGTGEQVVTSSIIAGGAVAFSTNRPVPAASGTCTTTLGEARGYYMNVFNSSGVIGTTAAFGGARNSVFAGGGLPPSPVLVTVVINGSPQTVAIGVAQKSGGASSPLAPQKVTPLINPRRTINFWRGAQDNY